MEDGCCSGLLRIRHGRVDALLPAEQIPDGPVIDARDARVIPGIIDTHNHGTRGWSLEHPRGFAQDVETVCRYVKACASQGITGVFPTAVPAMISACAQAAALHPVGAEICGIHSEGPWLARSGEGGSMPPCAPADMNTAYSLWEDARGLLRLVSLAPETPGVWPVVDFFLSHGVTVGAAHSNNRYAAAMAAYDRGISVSTHTGNVMTGIHHRDIGGLGAALTHPDVECEVICDGQHICPEMLRLYFTIKSPSRFLIISDSTAFCGTPPGYYTLPNGETRHVTSDGQILTSGGRRCGSARPALFGIRTLTEKCTCHLRRRCVWQHFNLLANTASPRGRALLRLAKMLTLSYSATITKYWRPMLPVGGSMTAPRARCCAASSSPNGSSHRPDFLLT